MSLLFLHHRSLLPRRSSWPVPWPVARGWSSSFSSSSSSTYPYYCCGYSHRFWMTEQRLIEKQRADDGQINISLWAVGPYCRAFQQCRYDSHILIVQWHIRPRLTVRCKGRPSVTAWHSVTRCKEVHRGNTNLIVVSVHKGQEVGQSRRHQVLTRQDTCKASHRHVRCPIVHPRAPEWSFVGSMHMGSGRVSLAPTVRGRCKVDLTWKSE